MTELEKIEYPKSFMDKLANGINPLDDTPIPEGDIANNVRLSRCFFYVSDILRQVIENGGVTPPVKPPRIVKEAFHLSEEAKATLQVSETPLSVSEIADCLNDGVDEETTKRIAATTINAWLVELGFLTVVELHNGKTRKKPTPEGNELGIFTEERVGQYGPYTSVLFSADSQRFIYDHVDAIIDYQNRTKAAKKEQRTAAKAARDAYKDGNHTPVAFLDRPWTDAHDERLRSMTAAGATVAEMAFAIKRTEEGIRERLRVLGLM